MGRWGSGFGLGLGLRLRVQGLLLRVQGFGLTVWRVLSSGRWYTLTFWMWYLVVVSVSVLPDNDGVMCHTVL